ncbi:MAG TPA: hypothetical protein VFB45_22270 [Pseudolabrys sp.]|nr:hypothetical protein [Pseudolabrys sp.]
MESKQAVRRDIFTTITDGWRRWRDRRAALFELKSCGEEVTRIATELGMSTGELIRITANGPEATRELHERLAVLNLARQAAAEPLAMRDLERVCARCTAKRICNFNLETGSAALEDSYCPNRETLRALARSAQQA